MKKIRKVSMVAFVAVLFAVTLLTGCGTPKGKLYTLQEAYDKGFLTHDNLLTIAELHNNRLQSEAEFDERIEKAIFKTAEETLWIEWNMKEEDVKAEDFEIERNYGEYEGSYVFILNEPYFYRFQVDLDLWIDIAGVAFHYHDENPIRVWKEI